MKSCISCYFYPTTLVCVDDDFNLLKSLKIVLEERNRVAEFYNPFEAEAFLENKAAELSATQFITTQSFDKSNIHLQINKIHELIYDAKRFDEVSTLIVDYYMPGIDGLKFCRNFAGSPYKKIMLTGEADQALAVAAFNEGVLDQFVMKGEADAIAKVEILVKKMQDQFFRDKTKFLVESLLQLDPEGFQYFTDADFCEKLHKLLEEHEIKELYLFNQEGAYLLIDESNQLWWLRIKCADDVKALEKEARSAFLQEPSPEAEAIYKLVEKSEKMPLFVLLAHETDIEHWGEILVDPIEIKTPQETYQVLIGKDIGKAALRYQDIQFMLPAS